jgi:hypothetical protein
MDMALEMRVVGVIARRELLRREPAIPWATIIDQIRRAGYTTSEICFVLNVARGTLWRWESSGSIPNYEDGRALLQLHDRALSRKRIPSL